jgi:LPXTG-motif cell wall-anchored protein
MKTKITVVAAAFLLGLGIGAPIASAYPLQHKDETTTTTDPGDETTTTTPIADPGQQLAGEATQASGSLPVTGGDVVGIALLGAGAVAAGTVLVRRTRKA